MRIALSVCVIHTWFEFNRARTCWETNNFLLTLSDATVTKFNPSLELVSQCRAQCRLPSCKVWTISPQVKTGSAEVMAMDWKTSFPQSENTFFFKTKKTQQNPSSYCVKRSQNDTFLVCLLFCHAQMASLTMIITKTQFLMRGRNMRENVHVTHIQKWK